MHLASFLNKVFKKDGFILIDANNKEFIIGSPTNEKPIKVKLLDKGLSYKLLFHPDLYFGEAYTDGNIKIENGSLTDFLNLALMNFGRNELNIWSFLINKLRGTYRYLTNFNYIKKSKKMFLIIMIFQMIYIIYFWILRSNILVHILKMKMIH